MFTSSKDIIVLQSQIDDLRSEVKAFKKNVLEHLKLLTETMEERDESTKEVIYALKDGFDNLNKWDDMTRSKIRAILNYMNVDIRHPSSEYEIVKNEEPVEQISTDNQ